MSDSNPPLVLVVCNDYGELALAMYLIDRQPFAFDTTLMLPPRLHANNPDVLPGRTVAYESLDDVRKQLESRTPGILGLFSGYLLPIHSLCETDDLDSLLRATQAKGWKTFTSDPFVGLLDDLKPSELVTLKSPSWSIIWFIFAPFAKRRLSRLLSEMHGHLQETPHVYPLGVPHSEDDDSTRNRLYFHNPAFLSQVGSASTQLGGAVPDGESQSRWLFVLGDQDYTVQEGRYGNRKFRKLLIQKLHETLEAGRVPTLIAKLKVINWVRRESPVADAMELLTHCDFSQFQRLLKDSEYVFYWNAASFSSLLRTMQGKPWFTFDDGHLLRGMSPEYATRVAEWVYKGCQPPHLDIATPMTCQSLQRATADYLKSTLQIQQGLLGSSDPQALLAALAQQDSPVPESDSLA